MRVDGDPIDPIEFLTTSPAAAMFDSTVREATIKTTNTGDIAPEVTVAVDGSRFSLLTAASVVVPEKESVDIVVGVDGTDDAEQVAGSNVVVEAVRIAGMLAVPLVLSLPGVDGRSRLVVQEDFNLGFVVPGNVKPLVTQIALSPDSDVDFVISRIVTFASPKPSAGQTEHPITINFGGVVEIGEEVDLVLTEAVTVSRDRPILVAIEFKPPEDRPYSLHLIVAGNGPPMAIAMTGVGLDTSEPHFLHPVIELAKFFVDYDGDGSEKVLIKGDFSHTHDPPPGHLVNFKFFFDGELIQEGESTRAEPTGTIGYHNVKH
eukprot:Selendium_serpulae@DN7064_c0_g1_i1.p1